MRVAKPCPHPHMRTEPALMCGLSWTGTHGTGSRPLEGESAAARLGGCLPPVSGRSIPESGSRPGACPSSGPASTLALVTDWLWPA